MVERLRGQDLNREVQQVTKEEPGVLTSEQKEAVVHNAVIGGFVTEKGLDSAREQFGLPPAVPEQISRAAQNGRLPQVREKKIDPHSGGFYIGGKK